MKMTYLFSRTIVTGDWPMISGFSNIIVNLHKALRKPVEMTLFNTTLITLFTELISSPICRLLLCCAFLTAIAVLVVRCSAALFAVAAFDEREGCFAPVLRFLFWHVPA